MLNANPGKQIEIDINGKTYSRYPIKTEVFKKGDDYARKIALHVQEALKKLPGTKEVQNWYIIISEKIVAVSQGRSYFIKDIHPSWIATTLSKYVTKTPYGIGLGSPWTMELAIREVGLPRIVLAAGVSILTKPFGIKGVFYHIAGSEARSIDGPTSYSLYPSNVSAKLAPKDPQKASEKIAQEVLQYAKRIAQDAIRASQFGGAVIIDANDLGRNVLGNTTSKPDSFFEEVMRDNPMGQGREQTPIVICIEN